jgi:hypothetical protein
MSCPICHNDTDLNSLRGVSTVDSKCNEETHIWNCIKGHTFGEWERSYKDGHKIIKKFAFVKLDNYDILWNPRKYFKNRRKNFYESCVIHMHPTKFLGASTKHFIINDKWKK